MPEGSMHYKCVYNNTQKKKNARQEDGKDITWIVYTESRRRVDQTQKRIMLRPPD